MECSVLAVGQAAMRPSSQAAWASGQLWGVPSTRMSRKSSAVFSGKGETRDGRPGLPGLA